MQALFPYPGGKRKLSKLIVDKYMPDHEVYLELFFGSGAIFFEKPKAKINYINDKSSVITNFFEQVRDNTKTIKRLLLSTPYSEEIVKKLWENYNKLTKDKKALAFWLLQYSFNSCAPYAQFHKQESAWKFSVLVKLLYKARKKLDGVYIINRDFRDVLKKNIFNNEECWIYVDPPYVQDIGYYSGGTFSVKDHKDLAELLNKTKAKVTLSYDDTPLIRSLYNGWNFYEIKYNSSMSTCNDNKKTYTELIITNWRESCKMISLMDYLKDE